jgi:ribosomal protein L13E
MSEKRKKGKPASKEVEPKRTRSVFIKPKASAPSAWVGSRHDTVIVERAGKGFSMGELAGAGLPPSTARRWGVSTDLRRRSVLERNAQALKLWFTPPHRGEQPIQPKAVKKEEPAKKRTVKKEEPAKKRTVKKEEPAKKRTVKKEEPAKKRTVREKRALE